MKLVTLMRHGKSDWSAPFNTDYDRLLRPRGRRDAKRMGAHVLAMDLVPEMILSSPARRAHDTAELFAEAMGFVGDIEWEGAIYGAMPSELLSIVRRLPDVYDHVALVGHNPGFEDVCYVLAGRDPHGLRAGIRMPTAALAHLTLAVDSWGDVQAECGQLEWLTTPRDLKEGHA